MYFHLRDSCDPPDQGIYIYNYEDRKIARISDLHFSIIREMAPLYQLGTGVSAISFGRGKQGIGGTFKINKLYSPIPDTFSIKSPNVSLFVCNLHNENLEPNLYYFSAKFIKNT